MYQLELIWNREFDFVRHGSASNDLDAVIKRARDMEESGDGMRVKKTRIVDQYGTTVWQYGKLTTPRMYVK
jgi:hypothetical protein